MRTKKLLGLTMVGLLAAACSEAGTTGPDLGSSIAAFNHKPAHAAKEQCKNGGYTKFVDENGQPFKNQGQCVAYANRHGTLTPVDDDDETPPDQIPT